MRYGIPYQGSKNSIAEWVVDHLPASDVLVDLFAGGCAVTHCALLSGKYKSVIANDLTPSVEVFADAVAGEFEGYSHVPTREEFFAEKDEDDVVALLYSFGNNRTNYLWGEDVEPVKVSASKMLCLPSVHERRMAYREFCRALADYLKSSEDTQLALVGADGTHGLQGLQGLESMERLEATERLEVLQGLKLSKSFEVLRLDYRDVEIPEGATVYADPPYVDTRCEGYAEFEHSEYVEWLAQVQFMVVGSGYEIPDGCVEVAQRGKRKTMCATDNSTLAVEKLYVQERFLKEYEERMSEGKLALEWEEA